jgi:predicted MFS family arabinose efflux permease
VLTAVTAVMFLGVLTTIPETLPVERRGSGGIASMARDLGSVLRRRRYVGYLLGYALAFAALFAYISGSPFVRRRARARVVHVAGPGRRSSPAVAVADRAAVDRGGVDAVDPA